MSKVHNFSAGPCILPQEVLTQASEAVKELSGIGLSLIEISHRSKDFVKVMEDAQQLVKDLLNVPDNYSVLFLQGGASLGFYKTALNFIKEGQTAHYINTGTWAKKAIKEAKLVGDVNVLASSEEQMINRVFNPTSILNLESGILLEYNKRKFKEILNQQIESQD